MGAVQPQRSAIIARIVERSDELASDWRLDTAATYLLASDEDEAKDCLRRLVPRILDSPYLAEKGFWQGLEALLDRPPVERCLAHASQFESSKAFALLEPADAEVEGIVELLVALADKLPVAGEPVHGLFTLSAIWALAHAEADTALRLIPRIKPSRWIERQELDALATRLQSQRPGAIPGRAGWVRSLHPAMGRDPLGGALMRSVLCADPNDIFSREWIERTPGDWVLYGDLDNLRSLNDTLGFLAGDLAIRGTVQTLQELLGDQVIRFGGEEFLLFQDGADGVEAAELLRQKIESASYAPIGHLDEPLHVTISFGVARGGKLVDALRAAEEALDQAKQAGRNRVVAAP